MDWAKDDALSSYRGYKAFDKGNVMMSVLEKNNKIIYVTLLGLICMVLALSYIPALNHIHHTKNNEI